MKYQIIIEEIVEPTEGSKYPLKNEVYKQIVFGLNIEWLVTTINTRNDEK